MKDSKGRFVRIRRVWGLDNFEDGYVDASGRMRVYVPGHPRSSNGYVMRSIVAYESYHGISVPLGVDVHHINHVRTDDSRSNLELIDHAEHTRRHKTKPRIELTCHACDEPFLIPKYRVHAGRGKYCSHECYVAGRYS